MKLEDMTDDMADATVLIASGEHKGAYGTLYDWDDDGYASVKLPGQPILLFALENLVLIQLLYRLVPIERPATVRAAAIRMHDGRIFEGALHPDAAVAALEAGAISEQQFSEVERYDEVFEQGYTQQDGTFISRDEARRRFGSGEANDLLDAGLLTQSFEPQEEA